MKKALPLGLAAAALVGLLVSHRPTVEAADHADGPAASADPAADITDVFAWMSPDANDVHLVMDLVRAAGPESRFSNQVQYVFHTSSRSAFGAAAGSEVNVICEFDRVGLVSCWVGNQAFVKGDASPTAGLASEDGRLKVYAGLRNDPFFFNLTGFKETAKIVEGAAASLDFDAAGCPALDKATSGVLVSQLKSGAGGTPARDDFGRLNVLSIVVDVDKSLLTANGPVLSVWGSTNRKS